MASTLPTPRACGWRSLTRKCEPTSDVLCRHHGTFSSAPYRRARYDAYRLATSSVLHRSGQKRAFSARLRAASHHLRTPSAVSRTMSCDLVETRMRIRPRESSLSHPFTAASCVPPASKRGATTPWLRSSLERRSRAACDRTSRRTQRTSTRDACDQLLPTTLRRRAPTSRSVIPGRAPLARRPTDAWRASRRPTHFGWSRFRLFEAGVFFPRRRPSSHPLTLPSPRSAYPPWAFACRRRPPHPRVGRACERAAETTRSRRPVTVAASTDDPERLPSDGRSLAPRGFPPAAFRFGTPPRSPGAARVHDDDAVRPISATTIRS